MKQTQLRSKRLLRPLRGDYGFLMIDVLIYIAIWTVIVGLAFAAFYRCLSNSRDLSRNADDIVRALRAGERWRQDVRQAVAAPTIVSEGGAMALEIPKASGLTVYVFATNTVWRKSDLAAPWEKFLAGVRASRMERQPRQKVIAWRWEVELQTKKKQVRVHPMFHFLSVAPPDQRP